MEVTLRQLRKWLPLAVILALVLGGAAFCKGPGRHGTWFSNTAATTTVSRRIPYACTAHGNAQWGGNVPQFGKTWFTSASGCGSGYPIQYVRIGCAFPRLSGEYWFDGPVRKGNGSSTSNYSEAFCSMNGHVGDVVNLFLWYNFGLGWADHQYL